MKLAEVLDRLRRGAWQVLGENFVGAYQVGSFALGAGDDASDVDFLIVVGHTPDQDQERGLRELHAALPDLDSPWAQHLEGSYAPAAELRRPGPDPWLYVDNGHREMEFSRHDNTLVTRWILREHGVVLAGPPPRDLVDPVEAEALRADARETLERWDADLRERPDQFGNQLAQQQHVLGLCRLLHRARYGRILPKTAAAQWVVGVEPGWSHLVGEAVEGRRLGWLRQQLPTSEQVQRETVRFHERVLELVR